MLQQQQRKQRAGLGDVGHEVVQDGGEPHRVSRQVRPQEIGPDARDVPGGEGQVDGLADLVETRSEFVVERGTERDAGEHDLLLRSRQARRHRCRRHEEQARDLVGGCPDDHPQRERRARLLRQRWVATQQDEVQTIVGQLLLRIAGRHPSGPDRDQGRLASGDRLGPQPPDDVPMSGGVQPGGRVGRNAVAGPALGGPCEGLTHGVFGQIETAGP